MSCSHVIEPISRDRSMTIHCVGTQCLKRKYANNASKSERRECSVCHVDQPLSSFQVVDKMRMEKSHLQSMSISEIEKANKNFFASSLSSSAGFAATSYIERLRGISNLSSVQCQKVDMMLCSKESISFVALSPLQSLPLSPKMRADSASCGTLI